MVVEKVCLQLITNGSHMVTDVFAFENPQKSKKRAADEEIEVGRLIIA